MKRYIAIVLILVSLTLNGCGKTQQSETNDTSKISEVNFDSAEYKSLISACRSEISAASSNAYIVAVWENTYLNTLGKNKKELNNNSIIEFAINHASQTSDIDFNDIEQAHDSIVSKYNDIVSVDTIGQEAWEIDIVFRNMYDAYSELYSIVVHPAENKGRLNENASDYSKIVSTCSESLKLYVHG